jgi:hypothetical protein
MLALFKPKQEVLVSALKVSLVIPLYGAAWTRSKELITEVKAWPA